MITWALEGFVLGVAVSVLVVCWFFGSNPGSLWAASGAVLLALSSLVIQAGAVKGEGEGGEQVLGSDGRTGDAGREQRDRA